MCAIFSANPSELLMPAVEAIRHCFFGATPRPLTRLWSTLSRRAGELLRPRRWLVAASHRGRPASLCDSVATHMSEEVR